MSPSLNRLTRALWPETAESWGLVLGVHEIVACRIARAEGSWRIAELNAEKLPAPLYKESPTPEWAAQLVPAIARAAAGAAGRYAPVCVAVPDPVVNLNVLELESLPRSIAEREALARWHLEKLWPQGTACACQLQDLGMADGKHLLLVAAMARAWLETLTQACRLANVIPTIWQPAIVYPFNRFHESLLRAGQEGVLLSMDPHAWSLLLWDADGRVRYSRSRWRDPSAGDEAEQIAVEVERLVRAYVHGGRGRHVEAVHLFGTDEAIQQVAARLDARMQNPCVQLSALAGVDANEGISVAHPYAGSALAAAMGFGP